jgi:hypothetical protein
VIAIVHRATAELKESSIENAGLKVGERAPAITLFNQDHVPLNSTELLREAPLLVHRQILAKTPDSENTTR